MAQIRQRHGINVKRLQRRVIWIKHNVQVKRHIRIIKQERWDMNMIMTWTYSEKARGTRWRMAWRGRWCPAHSHCRDVVWPRCRESARTSANERAQFRFTFTKYEQNVTFQFEQLSIPHLLHDFRAEQRNGLSCPFNVDLNLCSQRMN